MTENTITTDDLDDLEKARDAARGDDWPGAEGNPPEYLRAIAFALIDIADSLRFTNQILDGERGSIPIGGTPITTEEQS